MVNTHYSPLDYALADFLTDRSGFKEDEKRRFNEMVLTLSSAQGEGHSCIKMNAADVMLLKTCHLVYASTQNFEETEKPLVVEDGHLYLNRYWRYETRLVSNVLNRLSDRPVDSQSTELLDKYFPPQPDVSEVDWQRKAAKAASEQAFTIITGGPGTGKTTTVLKILALLQELNGGKLEIALAAPTGKAAMRLQQSLIAGKPSLPLDDGMLDSIPETVSTLHRLLGPIKQSNQFRHHVNKPLSCDLLVVDESSMIDVAMMSKLLDALHPAARLILLGDKDQLASVESGAVLNDLCVSLPEHTIELKKTWRFSGPIKALAEAINTQQSELAWSLLTSESTTENTTANSIVRRLDETWMDAIQAHYQPYIDQISQSNNPNAALSIFSQFQVLAAVRLGAFGVVGINQAFERRLNMGRMQTHHAWYHGKPIMITRNDPSLGLFNGDIGICLKDDNAQLLNVWFEGSDGHCRAIVPARLPQYETVYAMTIHKSQGSEFDHVMIVLPDKPVPLLSRELLYTAVTRAKSNVDIAASEAVFKYTVSQQVVRNSGIKSKIKAAQMHF